MSLKVSPNLSIVEEASKLVKKFGSDPTAYTNWVNETFPQMGHFLRTFGADCRIVVLNEAGGVLQTIEPAIDTENPKELQLIRSDDYLFRLPSSSSFEEETTGVVTLFKCLEAHLDDNALGSYYALDLLHSFYCFNERQAIVGVVEQKLLENVPAGVSIKKLPPPASGKLPTFASKLLSDMSDTNISAVFDAYRTLANSRSDSYGPSYRVLMKHHYVFMFDADEITDPVIEDESYDGAELVRFN
jgi:hypothetical protein